MADSYVETFFGHAGPVYHVAWSPGSADTFASASADGTACIWRLQQVWRITQYPNMESPVVLYRECTQGLALPEVTSAASSA